MYLKFVDQYGYVVRYNEIKKRIIISMVGDFKDFTKKRFKVTANKHTIDITADIELLHNILMTDFKANFFKFQSSFNNANFYVADLQQRNKNVLVMFGDLYLDTKTMKFYNAPIINGNVLLQNSTPAETPYYYKT